MKLVKFRINEFRSIEDSGWIKASDLTTLVGSNESGKTNLMIALWKLNENGENPVNPVQDMPRHKYYSLMNAPVKPVFVTACFALNAAERGVLAQKPYGDRVRFVYVGKDYDGKLHFTYAENADKEDGVAELIELGRRAEAELSSPESKVLDVDTHAALKTAITRALKELTSPTDATFAATMVRVADAVERFERFDFFACPTYGLFVEAALSRGRMLALANDPTLKIEFTKRLPTLVYYASCGNLDGQIDLVRAVNDYARTDLRGNEVQRRRIANKFLDMLNVPKEELLALGERLLAAHADPARYDEFLELKQKSEDIMNAAELRFNKAFHDWYGSSNYVFDFKMDGTYIRVRVSDDEGLEPIELEFRSEWLQWMFSFVLVLMSTGPLFPDSVLLLDEPEAALHPLSQVKLYKLLERKSKDLRIVFCTHSPFLVQGERLDRIVNVYHDDRGYTVSSEKLHAGTRDAQIDSNFAVSSAVRLMISDRLLESGIPVLTESVADQLYLSAYKNLLASMGELRTRRELVFIPCGGVAGIKAILPTLVGKNNFLPVVVLDETPELAEEIQADCTLFRKHPNRIVTPSPYRLADLAPRKVFRNVFIKYMTGLGYDAHGFSLDDRTQPIEVLAQAEIDGKGYLVPENWREEVASLVKLEIIRYGTRLFSGDASKLDAIKALFLRVVSL